MATRKPYRDSKHIHYICSAAPRGSFHSRLSPHETGNPESGSCYFPYLVFWFFPWGVTWRVSFSLADAETAQNALQLVHRYRLLGKPLVVEFGRERQEEEKQKKEGQEEKK